MRRLPDQTTVLWRFYHGATIQVIKQHQWTGQTWPRIYWGIYMTENMLWNSFMIQPTTTLQSQQPVYICTQSKNARRFIWLCRSILVFFVKSRVNDFQTASNLDIQEPPNCVWLQPTTSVDGEYITKPVVYKCDLNNDASQAGRTVIM